MRYICLKYKPELLHLNDPAYYAVVEQMAGIVGDILEASRMPCYTTAMSREDFTAKIIEMTDKVSTWFAKDGKHFIAGNHVSWVDFIYFELLELQDFITQGKIYTVYPHLKEYRDRVQNLPKLKDYIEGPDFMSRPLNNKSAKLNN